MTSRSTPTPRRGIVLLSVLVVVVLLTLAAYQYSELMMAEYKAAYSYTQGLQAKALAESGVAYVAANLSDANAFSSVLNNNPFDNPSVFQNVAVGEPKNGRQGRFSVISLRSPDDDTFQSSPYAFGCVDEGGKININDLLLYDSTGNVGYQMLMALPNMTDDIANSILDWISAGDTPRSNGAKSEYYSALNPPYQCKNGPINSLDELLLVKGVTVQLLFGNDRNRNGVLDPEEDDGSGQVDLGWAAYLTIYSREPNVDVNGNPRVYLNDADLNNLETALAAAGVDQSLIDFIVAYRMYGPAPTVTVTVVGRAAPAGRGTMAPAARGSATLSGSDQQTVRTQMQTDRSRTTTTNRRLTPVSSMFDLVTAKVAIPTGTGNSQRTVTMPSPLSDPNQLKTLLPQLLDLTTTIKSGDLPARINVLTASKTVLAALPGLQPADVQAILDHRPDPTSTDPPDAIFQTPAWLLTEANLSTQTLKTLERYVTSRSKIYRFQVVGYFDGGKGGFSRVEAVVDTNNGRPRIVYYRDLSELGQGFASSLLNPNN
jgi:type II secretory pathway component PulK